MAAHSPEVCDNCVHLQYIIDPQFLENVLRGITLNVIPFRVVNIATIRRPKFDRRERED
jgi:hypothetical protein